MLAVRRGQLEVSRVLLEAGADREKMNVDGKTAKEMSMDSGNVAIINLLNNKNTHVSALGLFFRVSLRVCVSVCAYLCGFSLFLCVCLDG